MQEQVTVLLARARSDEAAASALFGLVYEDLRALASARMRHERPDHTLQATALVSEAFVRLVGPCDLTFVDRQHFFRIAAEAMRRVLIDHSRARLAEKRGGGGGARVPIHEDEIGLATDPARLLALDEAMVTLAKEDPRAEEMVRLRFFAGLSVEQAAELMGVSPRTALRDWGFARARLTELLKDES